MKLFEGGMPLATTRIIPMHINKGKTLAQCLSDRMGYGENPEKRSEERRVGKECGS